MEKTIASKRVFDGKVLQLDELTIELDSGRKTTRAIVHFPQVVVIFPVFDDGSVICVRQFRKPIESNLVIEAVAGKIDPGESPDDAARRELLEETGYAAKTLQKIGSVYPAAGYSDELQHIYLATVEGPGVVQSAEDTGRVEVLKLTPQQFGDLMRSGDKMDGKLLSAFTLAAVWRSQ